MQTPKLLVLAGALLLSVAACGSSGGDTDSASGASGASATAAGPCTSQPDTSIDATQGQGAGQMQQMLNCAASRPLGAQGDPIKIGFLNHEGDPAGSFPEYTAGAQAAVDFINKELGGVGGNPATGVPGRPIELVKCTSKINPAETIACANTVAAAKPLGVFVALNFFGQPVYDVLNAAKIPIYVGSPISIADFTSPQLSSIGPGGGCVGVNLGQIDYAVNTLKARNIMTVWANTPPGVACYNEVTKKSLDVLSGNLQPTPAGVTVVPDLKYPALNFPPGTGDLTTVATQALEAEPDAILMTVSGSDCWNFTNALYAVGYDPATGPKLVYNDACNNSALLEEAGDQASEVYFVGPTNFAVGGLYEGLLGQEVSLFTEKVEKYQPSAEVDGLGFVGFASFVSMWQMMSEEAAATGGPGGLTPENVQEYVRATSNHHTFGGFPLTCKDVPTPFVALCNTDVQVTQWNGDGYTLQSEPFSGIRLVAGTKIGSSG